MERFDPLRPRTAQRQSFVKRSNVTSMATVGSLGLAHVDLEKSSAPEDAAFGWKKSLSPSCGLSLLPAQKIVSMR